MSFSPSAQALGSWYRFPLSPSCVRATCVRFLQQTLTELGRPRVKGLESRLESISGEMSVGTICLLLLMQKYDQRTQHRDTAVKRRIPANPRPGFSLRGSFVFSIIALYSWLNHFHKIGQIWNQEDDAFKSYAIRQLLYRCIRRLQRSLAGVSDIFLSCDRFCLEFGFREVDPWKPGFMSFLHHGNYVHA